MTKAPGLESAGRSLPPAPLSESKLDSLMHVGGIKVNIGLHVPPLPLLMGKKKGGGAGWIEERYS
jgi:hypothetical protein